MARTIDEIYNIMATAQAAEPDLAGLTSYSATAQHRLWKQVIATCQYLQEVIIDQFQTDVQAIADSAIPGTTAWWRKWMKLFQYNVSVTYILTVDPDGGITYDVVEPADRIITQVAVLTVNTGGVLIKVAKGAAGSLAKLSSAELAAAIAYAKEIKFAGTSVQVQSFDPNLLVFPLTVYYDATIPQATFQTNVEAAINGFLQGIDFSDAIFKTIKLEDAIQAVPGAIDIDITSPITMDGAPQGARFALPAGYGIVDPGNPLSATITYTPA